MSIENMCQRNSLPRGGLQVLIHVAKRIDQYPLFCIVRSNQIGRITQSLIHKRFDKPGLWHVKIIIALSCIREVCVKDIVEKIFADPRYQKNIEYGEPRSGHPEGKVKYHIAELEENLEKLGSHGISEEQYW